MPRKHVTRKIVNDPSVDAALRDIYDELDALQPEMSAKYSKRPPQIGDVRIVETSDGGTATATLTQGGWMVDINSNFQPVSGTSGYKSLKGTRGTSRTPVKNESIKYDKRSYPYLHIGNSCLVIFNLERGILFHYVHPDLHSVGFRRILFHYREKWGQTIALDWYGIICIYCILLLSPT